MGRTIFLILMTLGLAAAHPSMAACTLIKLAELPVTMEGLDAYVHVKIEGHDTTLIADTGAFYSTLTPNGARRAGLTVSTAPYGVGMTGVTGEVNTGYARAKQFQLLGLTLRDVDFLVNDHDFGSADGLLGQNLLGLTDMEYDFNDGVVRFFQLKDCDNAVPTYWAQNGGISAMDIYPIGKTSNAIRGEVRVNGVTVRAIFDTGGGHSILTLKAAKAAGIKVSDPGVVSGGEIGGVGRGVVETWIAPVKSFQVGDERIDNTRLRIADIQLSSGDDMLLGGDFFLSHRLFLAKSQNRLYFTYNGGPVFRLDSGGAAAATTGADTGDAPTDADGFARRAAGYAARGEYAQALADDNRAVALDPTNSQYLYDRAVEEARAGQGREERADLEAALKLKPDDADTLELLGAIELREQHPDAAKADFDAETKADPDRRLRVARLYEDDARYDDAVAEVGAWIAANPKSPELAGALNDRCWIRALWGQQLDQGLADCDQAVRLTGGSAEVLDSRGMLRLRRGDYDAAITDYAAALKLNPSLASSLYGRGVAEAHKGLKAASDADLAAAKTLDPKIADQMTRWGVAP